jgi:hypothetical protein
MRLKFNLARNRARRAEWAILDHPRKSNRSMESKIELPAPDAILHPVAQKVQTAMEKASPKEDGRVHIDVQNLPEVKASPGQAMRIAQSLHVILERLAALGVGLKDGKEPRPTLHFTKNEDFLTLYIEEGIEYVERKPTAEEKRRPSWTWNNKSTQLTGKLTFRLGSDRTIRVRRYWTESASTPLELTLLTVIERMDGLFQKFEQDRAIEVQRQKDREEEAKRWRVAEAKRKHQETLNEITDERAQNLARASEWWRIYNDMRSFIETCEKRWEEEGNGRLSSSQEAWLTWAKTHAERSSPFELGYPDPVTDGPFDETSVPFGGPYPENKEIPDPPSLQKRESSSSPSYYGDKSFKPYPFWLRHQAR